MQPSLLDHEAGTICSKLASAKLLGRRDEGLEADTEHARQDGLQGDIVVIAVEPLLRPQGPRTMQRASNRPGHYCQ